MTPTAAKVFKFIQGNAYCSTAGYLARLMMSMHNGDTSVSFYYELKGLDADVTKLVVTLVTEFLTGVYKDGDFNPVAEWLIDVHGFISDEMKKERDEWIFDRKEELAKAFRETGRNISGWQEWKDAFRAFCVDEWKKREGNR